MKDFGVPGRTKDDDVLIQRSLLCNVFARRFQTSRLLSFSLPQNIAMHNRAAVLVRDLVLTAKNISFHMGRPLTQLVRPTAALISFTLLRLTGCRNLLFVHLRLKHLKSNRTGNNFSRVFQIHLPGQSLYPFKTSFTGMQ